MAGHVGAQVGSFDQAPGPACGLGAEVRGPGQGGDRPDRVAAAQQAVRGVLQQDGGVLVGAQGGLGQVPGVLVGEGGAGLRQALVGAAAFLAMRPSPRWRR